MEFGKSMAVSSFDWDDSALIKEYDRIMKQTKKSLSKKKEKSSSDKEDSKTKEEKPWAIGNYCRAVFQEDGQLYEAEIVAIHDDTCTVDFLGYGDKAEVLLESLQESQGKRARQKQRKIASRVVDTIPESDTDYSNAVERGENPRPISPIFYGPDISYNHPHYDRPARQMERNFDDHCLPTAPTARQFSSMRMGEEPPPPPPPMPQCLTAPKDPALSSMLMAWYMAGYYTGLHQNQRSHCASPRRACCCNHRPVQNCCNHSHY